MIKIGLDIHGVINSVPKFFSELSQIITNAHGEIHIITGAKFEKVVDFLEKNNIVYTHFFSIVEEANKSGHKVEYDENGDPWVDLEFWNRAKAKYCKDKHIDLHIDDSEEYVKHFVTPYAIFKNKNK